MNIKITGLNIWQQLHLRTVIARCRPRLDAPAWIEFTEYIPPCRYHSLWHGGEIGIIHYKGWRFSIYACGDVYADLYDAKDGGRHLEYVKDKGNRGLFGDAMRRYFPSDRQLVKVLANRHRRYCLELENNNWWECFVIDPDGGRHDMMWCLDAWALFPAVAEILSGMDFCIKEIDAPRNGNS